MLRIKVMTTLGILISGLILAGPVAHAADKASGGETSRRSPAPTPTATQRSETESKADTGRRPAAAAQTWSSGPTCSAVAGSMLAPPGDTCGSYSARGQ